MFFLSLCAIYVRLNGIDVETVMCHKNTHATRATGKHSEATVVKSIKMVV